MPILNKKEAKGKGRRAKGKIKMNLLPLALCL